MASRLKTALVTTVLASAMLTSCSKPDPAKDFYERYASDYRDYIGMGIPVPVCRYALVDAHGKARKAPDLESILRTEIDQGKNLSQRDRDTSEQFHIDYWSTGHPTKEGKPTWERLHFKFNFRKIVEFLNSHSAKKKSMLIPMLGGKWDRANGECTCVKGERLTIGVTYLKSKDHLEKSLEFRGRKETRREGIE
jgi:hypothetical protein